MDLFHSHILRQRTQSTWVFTDSTSGKCTTKSREKRDDDAENAGHDVSVVLRHEQQPNDLRTGSMCRCETLESALVTIDILRSKLVS